MANGFIKINGQKVPYPDSGLKLIISTLTNGGRNKNGKVTAERVGRDQNKIDSLQWKILSAKEWSRILNLVKDYYIDVTFPNMLTNTPQTLRMYVGDREAEPVFLDDSDMPTQYKNCKFNIIDVGEIE